MGNNIDSKLRKIDSPSLGSLPEKGNRVRCKVTSVYDGDTCTVIYYISGPEGTPFKINIRFRGIDAPELRGNGEKESNAAKVVRDILYKYIYDHNKDGLCWVVPLKWDKYGGRVVGDLYLHKKDKKSLSDILLEKGLVKPYGGNTVKSKWTNRELNKITNQEDHKNRI